MSGLPWPIMGMGVRLGRGMCRCGGLIRRRKLLRMLRRWALTMAGAVRTLCGMIERGPIIRLGMGYVLVHSRRMLLRDANNHLRTKRLNCLLYTSGCLFYKSYQRENLCLYIHEVPRRYWKWRVGSENLWMSTLMTQCISMDWSFRGNVGSRWGSHDFASSNIGSGGDMVVCWDDIQGRRRRSNLSVYSF